MDRAQRDLQHVGLPTAASIVHIEVTGMPPDATKPVEMRDTLNDIAHAMSVIVAIYARDSTSGLPVEIPIAEVVAGKFIRGAHRLVTETGVEYAGDLPYDGATSPPQSHC